MLTPNKDPEKKKFREQGKEHSTTKAAGSELGVPLSIFVSKCFMWWLRSWTMPRFHTGSQPHTKGAPTPLPSFSRLFTPTARDCPSWFSSLLSSLFTRFRLPGCVSATFHSFSTTPRILLSPLNAVHSSLTENALLHRTRYSFARRASREWPSD